MWDIFNVKGLVIAALIFVPLEHLLALHNGQRHLRRLWRLDLVYALFNSLITKAGLGLIVVAAALASEAAIPTEARGFVSAIPLWAQVPLAIVLSDLGFYSVHRIFHRVPMLWKFHLIHHSIEELDWLAAHRVHPIDQICTKGASLLPLVVLGFSDAAFTIYAVIYYWQSLLIHANVRVAIGPLRWFLASPQFHHWHNANQPEAYDKNFAGQLPVLDFLFGTLHLPSSRYPERYGTRESVPSHYVKQLTYPFGAGPPVPGEPRPSGPDQ